MRVIEFVSATGVVLVLGLFQTANACAMGGVPAHNMAHDGTATCVTCKCAHHKSDRSEMDQITKLDQDNTNVRGADIPVSSGHVSGSPTYRAPSAEIVFADVGPIK